tara:strand:+ start:117 stop:524 length:408 start_codon:yes stop_codon:yes gene_type:complete
MSISSDNEAVEPEVPESVTLEEAISNFGDNPPDGFVMTMIFWKRELSDSKHKGHTFLEMLKTNFELVIRKRDVVMKDMHFYQVDIFGYGDGKYMLKTITELDKIIAHNLESLKVTPTMNIGFCMKPESDADNDLF